MFELIGSNNDMGEHDSEKRSSSFISWIIHCSRYKYFSHLRYHHLNLNKSQERQPLARMLSAPSPVPSAEGIAGLGEFEGAFSSSY